VLRYESGDNPNGATGNVAAVRNASGNVMGLMPHPEHAVDPLLGSEDGARILGSLVDAAGGYGPPAAAPHSAADGLVTVATP
jgi:phosphoribosylformylglycinamidine synthase subunit PurQ / glutaminase